MVKGCKGHIFILSGPSAVGKTTVMNRIVDSSFGREYSLSSIKSYTTRKPRGKDDYSTYEFLSEEDFLGKIESGGMLEYSKIYGKYYGTDIFQFNAAIENSENIVKVLDHVGAYNLVDAFGKEIVTLILLVPPSLDVLRSRMVERGTAFDSDVDERLSRAADDMNAAGYDYVVIADDADKTVCEVEKIISSVLG